MKLHLLLFLAWVLWVTLWIIKEVQASHRRRQQQRNRQGS